MESDRKLRKVSQKKKNVLEKSEEAGCVNARIQRMKFW